MVPTPRPDLSAAEWRKSSYSNTQGGDCVEVADGFPGTLPVRDSKDPAGPALVFSAPAWTAFVDAAKGSEAPWRKSSYSNPSGGDCVEVADGMPGLVPVRDSKQPDRPVLLFPAAAWAAFLADVKRP